MKLTAKQKRNLGRWKEVSAQLSSLKEEEAVLRDALYEDLCPNKATGTHTVDLNAKYALKFSVSNNQTLDEDRLPAVLQRLPLKKRKLVVRYKPSLVQKQFDTLSASEIMMFDICVSRKPGKPTLDIVRKKDA